MEEPKLCERCKGIGFIIHDLPVEHKDFGKAFACKCTLAKMQTRRWANCGVPESHRNETFATFNPKLAKEAYDAALDLTMDKIKLLILCGSCGVGKTHLAHAIVISAIDIHVNAKFIRAKDWLDELKGKIRHDKDHNTCQYDIMRSNTILVPVLAIDELKYRTEYDIDAMDDLITNRLASDKRTIITTNHTIEDLKKTFPRVVSRANDVRYGRIIRINASDYRETAK